MERKLLSNMGKKFLKFLRLAKKNKIDVIVGISPGLDFDYKK